MTLPLEFMVPKAESNAFDTALYRFVEMKQDRYSDDLVMLTTEPYGIVDRKLVTLWSMAALTEFTQFWSAYRRSPVLRGRPTPLRWGPPELEPAA
jgi:hypothetical protein